MPDGTAQGIQTTTLYSILTAPLAGLQELETFLFYESTDVADGDLTVLKRLPEPQHVVFMDRPHYSGEGKAARAP